MDPINKKEQDNDPAGKNLPGYPPYPASEDIYMTDKKADDIDPDDESHIKTPVADNDEWDDVEDENLHLDDMDVPGSESDDDLEDIGEEDEENNYYSLGGDNHDE